MTVKKEVATISAVTVAYVCDVCSNKVHSGFMPNEWAYLTHEHQGWGNDSHESLEKFHCCSVECTKKQLTESTEKMEGRESPTIEILGSPTFFKKLIDDLK